MVPQFPPLHQHLPLECMEGFRKDPASQETSITHSPSPQVEKSGETEEGGQRGLAGWPGLIPWGRARVHWDCSFRASPGGHSDITGQDIDLLTSEPSTDGISSPQLRWRHSVRVLHCCSSGMAEDFSGSET